MDILNGIFLWLVASSLRASLLAIVVYIFQFTLGRKLSAVWRYALWLPVALVFVLPVLPGSRWSAESRLALLTNAMPSKATASLPTNVTAAITAACAVPSILGRHPLVAATWLFGVSTVIAVAGVGYRRTMQRILRESVPVAPELVAEVAAAAGHIRLRTLPRVIVSAAVDSPAVAGLFRPMLLLPANFPAGLSLAEARLILLHELTHLRRHDLPLNWILCVLQALHWFNPLLWFAFGCIRADREAACDAQVLSAHAEDRRADYGHALLKLHRAAPLSDLSLGFSTVLAPGTLRARLLAITRHRRANPAWNAAGALAIAGLVLAGATRAPSEDGFPPMAVVAGNTPTVTPAIVPVLLTGRAEAGAFSGETSRGLYGQGSLMDRGRERSSQKNTAQDRNHALPDWWPAATSARILLNTRLPRQSLPSAPLDVARRC